MRVLALLFVVVATPSCLTSVCDRADSTCTTNQQSGAGGGMGGAGAPSPATRCEQVSLLGEVCVTLPERVVCAGKVCASGQECCFGTGQCFAANRPQDCAAADGGLCSSNAQCGPDEACITAVTGGTNFCIGLGRCQARSNCGFCSPAGSPRCLTCGCDGTTYPSIQDACVAGVRIAESGACGVGFNPGIVGCGTSSQCASGQDCCSLTGKCFRPAEPWRCQIQPDGTALNCVANAECNAGSRGSGGGDRFCAGVGCGTPGRCGAAPGSCGGELVPVCGCDAKTYSNECWARRAGVRVATSGACSDGGF
jgi:hypothetical protein